MGKDGGSLLPFLCPFPSPLLVVFVGRAPEIEGY